MTDKMVDQILKELEQSNRLVASLLRPSSGRTMILDDKV